jgi:hypothetical protein
MAPRVALAEVLVEASAPVPAQGPSVEPMESGRPAESR